MSPEVNVPFDVESTRLPVTTGAVVSTLRVIGCAAGPFPALSDVERFIVVVPSARGIVAENVFLSAEPSTSCGLITELFTSTLIESAFASISAAPEAFAQPSILMFPLINQVNSFCASAREIASVEEALVP